MRYTKVFQFLCYDFFNHSEYDKSYYQNSDYKIGLIEWWNQTIIGLQKGAINMVGVGIAIATAGIIVGAVGSTGLSTNLIIVIETIARDNVIILILLTIILCYFLNGSSNC